MAASIKWPDIFPRHFYVQPGGAKAHAAKTNNMPTIALIILCIIICASLGWVSLIPIISGFILGILVFLAKMNK